MKSTLVLSLLASLASAAVFSSTTFNDISIAGGTAGNAKQEALDALAGLPADLTTVDKADIDVCAVLPSLPSAHALRVVGDVCSRRTKPTTEGSCLATQPCSSFMKLLTIKRASSLTR